MLECCIGYGKLCPVGFRCPSAPVDAPHELPSNVYDTNAPMFEPDEINHLKFIKVLFELKRLGGENDGA